MPRVYPALPTITDHARHLLIAVRKMQVQQVVEQACRNSARMQDGVDFERFDLLLET
jgi:hypothetical protein